MERINLIDIFNIILNICNDIIDNISIIIGSELDSKGKAKVEIGLAKGKKLYDKRAVLKEKAVQRDLDRVLKNY